MVKVNQISCPRHGRLARRLLLTLAVAAICTVLLQCLETGFRPAEKNTPPATEETRL